MFIKAKFSSSCSETGMQIQKGDSIYWIKGTKLVYCNKSIKYNQEISNSQDAIHVQANEDAFFDNFCINNNI